jgi:hypothetical protein
MTRTAAHVLGAMAAIATLLPGQSIPVPQEPPPGFQHFDDLGVVHMVLPASWRELGPAEAQILGAKIPPGLRVTNPGEAQVFGDVDRWLEEGFDGRAMLFFVDSFELGATQENLDAIVAFHEGWTGAEGARRTVLSTGLGTIGRSEHPVMEIAMRYESGEPDHPPMRSRDLYASTMGRRLILSLRAWETDWVESEPVFRQVADSLVFARPPQVEDDEDLSDRLLSAVLWGSVTGVGLLVARMFLRGRPPA